MDDLTATRALLSQQLRAAIAADALAALPVIADLQRDSERHLREAVKEAAQTSSWSEIGAGLGVSKQAAHQRFKVHAKSVTEELKTEQRTLKRARRAGDAAAAAAAKARRDGLVGELRATARELKEQA